MAKLYFRYGAMNCGKTALLLQAVHNYESRNMHVLILKPSKDTKGENTIVSRIGLSKKVDHLIKEDDDLYKYISKIQKEIDCIFVDEAQFLKREQVDQLLLITIDKNIPVICYGLRSDFNTNGFEGSTRLLEIAHTIEELKTICKCGTKATFNIRKVNDKYVFEGDQLAIDGEQNVTYESLCPKCYYKIKNNYYKKNSKRK